MRIALVLLVGVVAVSLVLALTGSASSGRAAPPLPPRALAGPPATVASLRGKPALVDFFASWCGPCVAEAPVVARAAHMLRGRAEIVAVDWSDSRQYALTFVSRFRWSFPVLSDPNGAAGYAYGIQGLPSAFVLDAHGRIITRLLGPQTVPALVRAVERVG